MTAFASRTVNVVMQCTEQIEHIACLALLPQVLSFEKFTLWLAFVCLDINKAENWQRDSRIGDTPIPIYIWNKLF